MKNRQPHKQQKTRQLRRPWHAALPKAATPSRPGLFSFKFGVKYTHWPSDWVKLHSKRQSHIIICTIDNGPVSPTSSFISTRTWVSSPISAVSNLSLSSGHFHQPLSVPVQVVLEGNGHKTAYWAPTAN